MLGWKIVEQGAYRIPLKALSSDEEGLLSTFLSNVSLQESELSSIKAELDSFAHSQGIYLDHGQLGYLSEYLFHHVFGFAFLDFLLKDDSIEEISIPQVGKNAYVFIRKKGWQKVNAMFTTEEAVMETANKMAKSCGRRITYKSPRLDAVLPDGSRLHASLFPISGGELTIRKFRQSPFSPHELFSSSTYPLEALSFLSFVFQSDLSILIAGNTASGKTTSLNSFFSYVPLNERVVITEQTPEINIPHEHVVRLVASPESGVGMSDIIYDTFRMRPDRLIVGEARSAQEVNALFDSLLAGQARGCYATFHANSSSEALKRLSLLGISELDLKAIDLVVVQKRMLRYDPKERKNAELRRMLEIFDVKEGKQVFMFNGKGWKERSTLSLSRISSSLGITAKELSAQRKARESFIRKQRDFSSFVSAFQKEFYGL
ncbi:MAG: ATPase, T2SS/T4P/T4SS family [Candidatus Anstonellales archaeon]